MYEMRIHCNIKHMSFSLFEITRDFPLRMRIRSRIHKICENIEKFQKYIEKM